MERGTIQVRRQIARIDGEVVEAPLKTKNSYRSVSVGQNAVEILKEQRGKTASEYVFPSPTGGPISPDSVLHMLHRVLKRAGLPLIRFHDMRHPYVKPATKNFLKNQETQTAKVFGGLGFPIFIYCLSYI